MRRVFVSAIVATSLVAPAVHLQGQTPAQSPRAQQAAPAPDGWQIDPAHTSAQFAVKHMMVSTVRGTLGRASGRITYDGKDIRSLQAEVTIDVAGLDTGVDKRDDHLRSPDFFDAANHPSITFKSRRVVPGANGAFRLVGDLTIRGNTKEVTLDVEGPSPAQRTDNTYRTGATASGTINRKDFGLLWNALIETGGAVVGDEVRMTIDIEATRETSSTPN